jgi:hypothetical protein
MANVNYKQYGVYLESSCAQLIHNGMVGAKSWREIFEAHPGVYNADVSRIYFNNLDSNVTVTGTFVLNPFDEGKIEINFDADTFPTDTVIDGKTTVDYIINPLNFDPTDIKVTGLRLLLLDNIGDAPTGEGSAAWKNADNSNLVASANDIVSWDGTKWVIVFDASEANNTTFVTNLNTGIQYRYKDNEWLLSIDGEYPVGTWRIDLNG